MYFQELKKAASALDSGFLYSVISRLSTLEQQSPNAVKSYQYAFEKALKNKSIEDLAKTEKRMGTKGTMEDLDADTKFLLVGKGFDQFVLETQAYMNMPKPDVKTDNKAFREWLRTNQRNLVV
ncbi:hypothetical protein D5E87_10510 [Vibrio parahaemolyticus]|uniref:hypothetical protein n=1 Tax=Vibrio parahaemolyticus TaxID=670 RepID=UPI0010376ACD|nr:hypothetical protein [Vibrio parahaemolyticus]TBT06524.1 hypothetical protein D5E87_10510 [Vibrio parahaemolyticus]TOK07870.1 hypothetical protein CGI25_13430 [Vibrio parahaemolyticus]HCH1223246.1 hypothetical protein [Vibrio parahaemolyticus]